MSVIDDTIASAKRLEESGDTLGALDAWRKALRLGYQPEIIARLGRLCTLTGNDAEGEDLLLRCIAETPDLPDPYFFLGFYYKSIGRLNDAKERIEHGLTLQDWSSAHTMLGYVYYELSCDGPAKSHFLRASELDPKDDEAWCGLGTVSLRDDPQLAATYFQRAINIDAENALAQRELGHSLWATGQFAEAERAIRKALALNQNDAWAHDYLGQLLLRQDRYLESERELRVAIGIWPDLALFHCNLGDCLAQQHRLAEAEAEYKAALALDVSYYLANLRYAQLLDYIGQNDRARVYAERARASKPTDDRTLELLTRLKIEEVPGTDTRI